jgi:hypothetical protein
MYETFNALTCHPIKVARATPATCSTPRARDSSSMFTRRAHTFIRMSITEMAPVLANFRRRHLLNAARQLRIRLTRGEKDRPSPRRFL